MCWVWCGVLLDFVIIDCINMRKRIPIVRNLQYDDFMSSINTCICIAIVGPRSCGEQKKSCPECAISCGKIDINVTALKIYFSNKSLAPAIKSRTSKLRRAFDLYRYLKDRTINNQYYYKMQNG